MAKPSSKDNDSRLAKIRKTYDYYVERWAGIHEQLDADLKALSLDGPWPEAERKAREAPGNERPCLHEDVITQFNNMTTNQLEMNPMGIDVQPEGDGADEKTADWVGDRIRQVEYEQNGQHAYLTAGKCAVECSIGYWELETDWASPFSWERKIQIIPIQDPKTVLVDPDAKTPDWSDIQGAFKLTRLSHDDFKGKYPKAEIRDFEGFIGKEGYSRWLDAATVQVAAHWYVEKEKQTLLLIDDGTPEGWTIFEDDLPKEHLRRRGKVVRVESDAFKDLGHQRGHEFPIMRDSKRDVPSVKKCVTNGLEILEETDWDDEEIPILVVTGRVKFESGERVIESQTRKARTGQLLYDLCISSIQEETARIPKNMWLGYEGQFDTATNWKMLHREPSAFGEARATTEEAGSDKPLPLPTLVQREPQIQALLELKNSILLSIQNALGQASTERKDRASKSGKALEQLTEDMNVATYHYHNSLRMAQLRQYRIINRLLPTIENTPREVGLRDVKGNYRTEKIQSDHYRELGRHQVVISSAKYYQSLQEEQSDFAESLLKGVSDPNIMLAVLPDLIRMKGLGPYGDDLAKMVEAMQPPQMQQARTGDGQQVSPAMVQQLQQQAQQTIRALNAHAEQITSERDKLLFDKKAETQKLAQERDLREMEIKAKVDVAAINASVKERMDSLDSQVSSIKHIADTLVSKFDLQHQANENALDRQHEQDLAAGNRQHEQDLAQQNIAAAQQQQAAEQQAEQTSGVSS